MNDNTPSPRRRGVHTSELYVLVCAMLLVVLNSVLKLGIPIDDTIPLLIAAFGYAGLRTGLKSKMLQVLCIATAGALLMGCSTVLDGGNIVAVKTRTFGLSIGQSATTQTPEVKFGLVTTVVQLIPTRTNELFAPRYFDTYDLRATWSGGADVVENTGAGDVLVSTNGQGSAIIPRSVSRPVPLR